MLAQTLTVPAVFTEFCYGFPLQEPGQMSIRQIMETEYE